MYIYTIIVAIMYMYCVIDGVMWVVFEKKIGKTDHFFFFFSYVGTDWCKCSNNCSFIIWLRYQVTGDLNSCFLFNNKNF